MKSVHGQPCNGGLAPAAHRIAAGGIEWRYLEWGEHGPPFVLWHGITADAHNWWRTGPFLAGLGFHVFAPDLPGHGLTGGAPNYAAETTARLLDAWLHALAIDAPVLMGHSWGGMNALIHATLPDAQVRARALIFEDPALMIAADPSPFVPNYTEGLGTPPDQQSVAAIRAVNPRWHDCDAQWKAEARFRASRAAAEGFFYDNAGINLVDRLHEISVPALLLLGDHREGGIWLPEYIDLVQRTMPNIALEVIEGSTHNLHRDSWVPFSMALGRFVRQFMDQNARS